MLHRRSINENVLIIAFLGISWLLLEVLNLLFELFLPWCQSSPEFLGAYILRTIDALLSKQIEVKKPIYT